MMKNIIVAIVAVLAMAFAPAWGSKANVSVASDSNTVSMSMSSSGVTLASDTVIDDGDTITGGYAYPASTPKALIKIFKDASSDDGFGLFSLLGWFVPLIMGGGIVMMLLFLVVLPILLIVLLVWYIVKGRNRAKREDLRQYPPAAGGPAPQPQQTPSRPKSYAHRRDNAIRNMCIGGGVTVVSLILGLSLFAVAGVVVLCVGVADYLVCRNHSDEE